MGNETRGGDPDESRERAEQVVTRIRGRLLLLAVRPPFRFVDTCRGEADDYLRRPAEFVGFDEDETAAVSHASRPRLSGSAGEWYICWPLKGRLFAGGVRRGGCARAACCCW